MGGITSNRAFVRAIRPCDHAHVSIPTLLSVSFYLFVGVEEHLSGAGPLFFCFSAG